MLNHCCLFSGIGSFSLAASLHGYRTTKFVELNDYCQQVLAQNFPGADIHDDINTLDVRSLPQIDLLTAGVPCPPFSQAGARLGSEDSRNLFPRTLEVIYQIKPKFVVIENVTGLLTAEYKHQGKGSFFAWILWQLSQIGYMGEWQILSAAQFGLPHRRSRVFIVAYPDSTKFSQQPSCWSEQTRDVSKIASANKFWRGVESSFHRNDNGVACWMDIPIGVKSGCGINRKRRIALGNTVALPCAIEAVRRVKYLNSLVTSSAT